MSEAASHFTAAEKANQRAGATHLVELTQRDAGRALGARAAPQARRAHGSLRREGDVWCLEYAGQKARVRDTKGLLDLAALVARPGQSVAALDLAPRADGDAGEVVDAEARRQYRRRLDQIEGELDDADRAGDGARSVRLAAERDALLAQLSAALGLGGRPRRIGDPGERARSAVTWRIRDAIRRIEAVHPDLGRHLRKSVKTGTLCTYDPEEPVDWEVETLTS